MNGWIVLKKVLLVSAVISLFLFGCGDKKEEDKQAVTTEETEDTASAEEVEVETEEVVEATPQTEMFDKVIGLIKEGLAYDTGSYIKGDIPQGEYVFSTFDGASQYYAEKDASGNIIDNENFDSFGYVQVHEAGNIETQGVLISIDALDKLEVSGAKELYGVLNRQEDYWDAGYYKVGKDIEPGEYVIESYGEGYVSVETGPVGNSNIVMNENFNGKYAVNVQEGQYLKVSRAKIV